MGQRFWTICHDAHGGAHATSANFKPRANAGSGLDRHQLAVFTQQLAWFVPAPERTRAAFGGGLCLLETLTSSLPDFQNKSERTCLFEFISYRLVLTLFHPPGPPHPPPPRLRSSSFLIRLRFYLFLGLISVHGAARPRVPSTCTMCRTVACRTVGTSAATAHAIAAASAAARSSSRGGCSPKRNVHSRGRRDMSARRTLQQRRQQRPTAPRRPVHPHHIADAVMSAGTSKPRPAQLRVLETCCADVPQPAQELQVVALSAHGQRMQQSVMTAELIIT